MKIKTIVAAVALAGLMTACNSKSDKETDIDSTSVTTTPVGTADTTTINSTTSINVPVSTRTHFEQRYPQASGVVWSRFSTTPAEIEWDWYGWPSMDTSDYVASFYVDNNPYWIWYDQDGNWVGAVETVAIANVPEAVSKVAQSRYPGYTVESVSRENDKNRTAYELKMKKGDDWVKLLVAENGSILKTKTKTDGTKSKEKSS